MIEWLLSNPDIGWVAVLAYLFWEIRGPNGKIRQITESIRSITVVVRALARTSAEIQTDKVDDYLTDNGSQPDDFLSFSRAGGSDDSRGDEDEDDAVQREQV